MKLKPIIREIENDCYYVNSRLAYCELDPNRMDIKKWSETYIRFQNGEIDRREIRDFDLQDEKLIAAAKNIPISRSHVIDIFCRDAMPAGGYFPFMEFSPLSLLAAEKAEYRNVLARRVRVPATETEIADFLHTSTGFTKNECRLCRKGLGFDIKQMASFLAALRKAFPVLFFYILSREYALADKFKRSLKKPECAKLNKIVKACLPNLRTDIITAACIIGQAQRLMQILMALKPYYDVEIDVQAALRGKLVATEVRRTEAFRKLRLSIQYSAFALREDFMVERCKLYRPAQPMSARAKEKAFVREMTSAFPTARPLAQPVPTATGNDDEDFHVERVSGSGGHRIFSLARYFGHSPIDLAAFFFMAAVSAAKGKIIFNEVNLLAQMVLDAAKYRREFSAMRSEDSQAWKSRFGLAFPKVGEFGHSASFDPKCWLARETDKERWHVLATSKGSLNHTANLAVKARDYLRSFSPHLVFRMQFDWGARMMCYLADCVGPYSSDPIWLRLRQRDRVLHDIRMYSPKRDAAKKQRKWEEKTPEQRARCHGKRANAMKMAAVWKDQIVPPFHTMHALINQLW